MDWACACTGSGLSLLGEVHCCTIRGHALDFLVSALDFHDGLVSDARKQQQIDDRIKSSAFRYISKRYSVTGCSDIEVFDWSMAVVLLLEMQLIPMNMIDHVQVEYVFQRSINMDVASCIPQSLPTWCKIVLHVQWIVFKTRYY